jgi:hypothetical protein
MTRLQTPKRMVSSINRAVSQENASFAHLPTSMSAPEVSNVTATGLDDIQHNVAHVPQGHQSDDAPQQSAVLSYVPPSSCDLLQASIDKFHITPILRKPISYIREIYEQERTSVALQMLTR